MDSQVIMMEDGVDGRPTYERPAYDGFVMALTCNE